MGDGEGVAMRGTLVRFQGQKEGDASFGPSGRKGSAMTMPARMNGELLHLWLCLLGWQIETGRDGDYAVGVGTHVPAEGSTLRIGGCGRTDGELALQLFEQAMLTYTRVYDAAHNELTAA